MSLIKPLKFKKRDVVVRKQPLQTFRRPDIRVYFSVL